MSDLLKLLKVNIINTYKLNNIFKKNKEGKKSALIALFVVLGGLGVFAIMCFQMIVYAKLFADGGFPQMVLIIGIILGVAITFIANISQVEGYLYKSKDFDMLMSLPLSRNTVMASKLVSLLLINYVTFALLYLPTVIAYCIFNPMTLAFWVSTIVGLLLIPLIPIVVSGFIFYFIGFIKINPKVKQITVLLLSIALFVLIMIGSMSINSVETLGQNITGILNTIKKLYYPGFLLYMSTQGEMINLVWFILMSVIPFIIYAIIISNNYNGINNRHRNVYTNKNFKLTTRETSSTIGALFKREVRRYFGNTNYCMNTIVGPIMSIVLLLILYFNMKDVNLASMGFDVSIIMLVIIVFSLGMNPTTSASISLEGKNFWIIKTAPVSNRDIFYSKIGVNLLICIPCVVINVVLSIVLFELPLLSALFIILIGFCYSLLSSIVGLYINICMPNFNWTQDIKVIKQSASVGITMLIGFLLTLVIGVPGLLMIMLWSIKSIYVYIYIFGITLICTIVFYLLLFGKGSTRYQKLEC